MINASIGFMFILVYLCVCTREADIVTINHALATIDQTKPIASLNTISVLYVLLAITPLCFALNCGAIGFMCYGLWKIAKNMLKN